MEFPPYPSNTEDNLGFSSYLSNGRRYLEASSISLQQHKIVLVLPCILLTAQVHLGFSPTSWQWPIVATITLLSWSHCYLEPPLPSLLLSINLIMSSHEVGGSSPSSLTLLLCLRTPQDSGGVFKQKRRRHSDTSAFQITITKFNKQHSKNYTKYTKKIHTQGTSQAKNPNNNCTPITCRPQPRQIIT
jgi:hypothetical protein